MLFACVLALSRVAFTHCSVVLVESDCSCYMMKGKQKMNAIILLWHSPQWCNSALLTVDHCKYIPTSTRSSAIAEEPRDASCQLKSCLLPRNSAETTCTSPEQIEVMKLEGYRGPMYNKHVHSTMTRSSRFHCLIGVINKPTTDQIVDITCTVYRRLAVAKFSKSTM